MNEAKYVLSDTLAHTQTATPTWRCQKPNIKNYFASPDCCVIYHQTAWRGDKGAGNARMGKINRHNNFLTAPKDNAHTQSHGKATHQSPLHAVVEHFFLRRSWGAR